MARLCCYGHHVFRTLKTRPLIQNCGSNLGSKTNVWPLELQNQHGIFRKFSLNVGKCRYSPTNPSCRSRVIKADNCFSQSNRTFKTSSRHDVNPLFWIVAKPLAKVASVVGGRTLRKLFQRLPLAERKKISDRIKAAMPAILIGIVGFSAVNYFTHIEETPITKRKRYITFTEEQFLKIAEFEYEMQIESLEKTIVPISSPYYKRVGRVIQRLVACNGDNEYLQKRTLTIIVVENKERNAFVLPTGHIFVYTGLLDMVQNEDQLAVVMGHELAHAILHHGAERISAAGFVDNIIILLLGAMWFFIPSDGIAIVTHWFFNKVVNLLLHLPYERKLETEADEVGLQLMAKACYDVRESANFWDLMKFLRETESGDDVDVPELFSTHPSNETRINALAKMIPYAIGIRDQCKCPRLSDRDPRMILQHMKAIVNEKDESSLSIGKTV